jgi:hypothetical protein
VLLKTISTIKVRSLHLEAILESDIPTQRSRFALLELDANCASCEHAIVVSAEANLIALHRGDWPVVLNIELGEAIRRNLC